MGRVFSLYVFCTWNLSHYFTLSLVSHKDGVVRQAFLYELCKRRYLFIRSALFLNYPYLMDGIKISRVISISIFFRLSPHFFVNPGGPFQRFYSCHWSELGSTKDKEIPPSFSSFFLVLFSVFPGFRGCTTGSLCASKPWLQMVIHKQGTLILRWPHRIGGACELSYNENKINKYKIYREKENYYNI